MKLPLVLSRSYEVGLHPALLWVKSWGKLPGLNKRQSAHVAMAVRADHIQISSNIVLYKNPIRSVSALSEILNHPISALISHLL